MAAPSLLSSGCFPAFFPVSLPAGRSATELLFNLQVQLFWGPMHPGRTRMVGSGLWGDFGVSGSEARERSSWRGTDLRGTASSDRRPNRTGDRLPGAASLPAAPEFHPVASPGGNPVSGSRRRSRTPPGIVTSEGTAAEQKPSPAAHPIEKPSRPSGRPVIAHPVHDDLFGRARALCERNGIDLPAPAAQTDRRSSGAPAAPLWGSLISSLSAHWRPGLSCAADDVSVHGRSLCGPRTHVGQAWAPAQWSPISLGEPRVSSAQLLAQHHRREPAGLLSIADDGIARQRGSWTRSTAPVRAPRQWSADIFSGPAPTWNSPAVYASSCSRRMTGPRLRALGGAWHAGMNPDAGAGQIAPGSAPFEPVRASSSPASDVYFKQGVRRRSHGFRAVGPCSWSAAPLVRSGLCLQPTCSGKGYYRYRR